MKKLLNISLIGCLFYLTSCNDVFLVIDALPDGTPPNEPIYLSGDFNNWREADERYRLKRTDDGRLGVELPEMAGTIEFKVNRGNWLTVEADSCGNDIPNRRLTINGDGEFSINIQNWKDRAAALCDFVTVVASCEATLGPYDELYLCGSHNDWKLYDPAYRLRSLGDSLFVGRLPRRDEMISYKVNRGDWSKVEVDKYGRALDNRMLGPSSPDSIFLTIEQWNDIVLKKSPTLTFVIKDMPPVAKNSQLYLASSINNWNPGDPQYRFSIPPGKDKYMLTIPRQGDRIFFKVTKGNWMTVERQEDEVTDIENREWVFGLRDTIHLYIKGWAS